MGKGGLSFIRSAVQVLGYDMLLARKTSLSCRFSFSACFDAETVQRSLQELVHLRGLAEFAYRHPLGGGFLLRSTSRVLMLGECDVRGRVSRKSFQEKQQKHIQILIVLWNAHAGSSIVHVYLVQSFPVSQYQVLLLCLPYLDHDLIDTSL